MIATVRYKLLVGADGVEVYDMTRRPYRPLSGSDRVMALADIAARLSEEGATDEPG